MAPRRARRSLLLVLGFFAVWGGPALRAAASLVAVSPGGAESAFVVVTGCPTFTWSDGGTRMRTYELAVYAVEPDGSLAATPAVSLKVPAGATSYTLSGDRCLAAGHYAWALRLREARGAEPSPWSLPLFFAVEKPGRDLERAVEVVLERWLREGRLEAALDSRREATAGAVGSPRAMIGESYAPPCDPLGVRVFSDVPDTNPACPWIEQAYADGLASSCAPDPLRFCPEDVVRRDQLTAMVGKAVGKVGTDICDDYASPAIACAQVPGFCASFTRPDCCPTEHKTVFVTSIQSDGDLVTTCLGMGLGFGACETGSSSGEAICNQLAATAGLTGGFKPWLSVGSIGPATAVFTHSSVPYCRVDKVKVADNWDDLIDCAGGSCLDAPINVTESGSLVGGSPFGDVWTGTDFGGNPTSATCVDWTIPNNAITGTAGRNSVTSTAWTSSALGPCSDLQRLYCFEQ